MRETKNTELPEKEPKNTELPGKEPLTMHETQRIALEILHTIAQICEERGLRYYLVYGTLIGAVRHQGFIPWDDDVDIMMPRPDHDLLMEYLDEHIGEYPHLEVFNRETCPDYPYMITRISDNRYDLRMENEKPFGMGVFIDIYPYDGLGNTRKEAVRFGMRGDRISSLCFRDRDDDLSTAQGDQISGLSVLPHVRKGDLPGYARKDGGKEALRHLPVRGMRDLALLGCQGYVPEEMV